MENEKKFRTKTGFCHILSDKIVLTRDGVCGNLADLTKVNHIGWVLTVYGVLASVILFRAYESFQINDTTSTLTYCIISVFLICLILISINKSTTPIIDRQSIKEIKFKKGIPALTRSRFEVRFEDEAGKIKTRRIILPRLLGAGKRETQAVLKIMEEEGLIKPH